MVKDACSKDGEPFALESHQRVDLNTYAITTLKDFLEFPYVEDGDCGIFNVHNQSNTV